MEGQELPVGWSSMELNDAGIWGSGGTPSRKNPRYYENGTIPWLVIGDLNDQPVEAFSTSITELGLINSSAKLIPTGSLLVAMYGSIGKLGITTFPCTTNQAIAFCIPNEELVELRYLFHALANAKPELIAKGQGGAQQNISQGILKEHLIHLSPLNEQRRIAAKLDTTLADVDACRQRLDGVAAILKRFRQAVLAAATAGELTREWREEMEISEVWDDTELGDLVSDIRYGTAQKCSYEKVGNPVLRIPNIIEGQISHEDLKYASFEPPEIDKLSIRNGDLLVIRSNGSLDLVGRTALASEVDEGFLFAGYLIRLRPRWEKVVPRFLLLVLSSPDTRRRVELAARSTSGVNNINSKFLSGLPLFLPSLEEQQEICRRAQDLFTLADQLEGRLISARKVVDRLTPALLAKAFRGELVPQDPNDEPASLLRERIRAASNAVPAGSAPSQRGRRKPLAHTELRSPAPAPAPTNDPSRVFLVRTGDETTQGERALSRVSKSKSPDILKGWSPMQKDLIQILELHLAWISASTACKEMGISDGSSSDDLELFYRQLKEQVEGGVVDVQRRGDEDWLRLSNREAA
ncbi:MAG: hypothetical protein RLZZ206_1823 [Cyanobacteriota bacterium]|jgi:type I restriction enzyme S subunit